MWGDFTLMAHCSAIICDLGSNYHAGRLEDCSSSTMLAGEDSILARSHWRMVVNNHQHRVDINGLPIAYHFEVKGLFCCEVQMLVYIFCVYFFCFSTTRNKMVDFFQQSSWVVGYFK